YQSSQLLRRYAGELRGLAHIFVISANKGSESFRGHLLGRGDFGTKADQPLRDGAPGTQTLGDRLLQLVNDIRRRLRRGHHPNVTLRREPLHAAFVESGNLRRKLRAMQRRDSDDMRL